MKIAIFHNLPSGGAKRTLDEQVAFLSKIHDLEIYHIKSQSLNAQKYTDYNVKTHEYFFEIESKLPSFFNRLQRDYRNFIKLRLTHKRIAKDIDLRRYDVVLVHTDYWTESPFILRYLKTPSVFHCHELLRIAYEKILEFREPVVFYKKYYETNTRKYRKLIDKKNAMSAKFIITSSNYIRNKVKIAYGKNAFTCHVGVNAETFKQRASKNNNKILFIGGKDELKGYTLLENALNLISKKIHVDLQVLGFGRDDKLIRNDRSLSLEYSKATITICTAHSEPFGLVALESMACETPVLAVNEGGYRETIVNNLTGHLLPRDPKVFAEKIYYLLKHPLIVNKMGKAGREHVIKNFSWQSHGKCLEKILYKASATHE